jgi:hypothetical protein
VTKRTTKKFICVDKKYGKEVEENYRNKEIKRDDGRKRWDRRKRGETEVSMT